MTTYYVAASGDDSNSGQSPEFAWASVDRAVSFLTSPAMMRGDSVLFRRGDTFYGKLSFSFTSATSGPRVLVGAFGDGPRPVISGYKVANPGAIWAQTSAATWRLDIRPGASQITGNRNDPSTNVGFLKVGNEIHANRRPSLATLNGEWDFFSNTSYLFVRAERNPSTLPVPVEIAVAGNMVNSANSIELAGLDLRGTGMHGYGGRGKNVVISGCRIHECGGSTLSSTSTVRAGNGVELWIGSEDVEVARNEIFDIFDAAVTLQGRREQNYEAWRRCRIHDNRIYRAHQSLELWSEGSAGAGTGWFDCSFRRNVCIDAGYGWSDPGRSEAGVHLLLYEMQLPIANFEIRENVFFAARDNYIYCTGGKLPSGFQPDENTVVLRPQQKIMRQMTQTVEQAEDWVAAAGVEGNSTFEPLSDRVMSIENSVSKIGTSDSATASALSSLASTVSELQAEVSALRHFASGAESDGTIWTQVRPTSLSKAYARVLRITVNGQARANLMLSYMAAGDSVKDRKTSGFLNIQAMGTATGPYVKLDVTETQLFKPGSGQFGRESFVAVVEATSDSPQSAVIGVYVDLVDDYNRMTLRLLNSHINGVGEIAPIIGAPVLTTLPPGSIFRAPESNPYVFRPDRGSAAPSAAPNYVGQEYITAGGTVYKAVGVASSADWRRLN